jgi:hypothetical protein
MARISTCSPSGESYTSAAASSSAASRRGAGAPQRFDLVVDIGTGIAAHHLYQPFCQNVELDSVVTAPRLDDTSINLVVQIVVLGGGTLIPKTCKKQRKKKCPTSFLIH